MAESYVQVPAKGESNYENAVETVRLFMEMPYAAKAVELFCQNKPFSMSDINSLIINTHFMDSPDCNCLAYELFDPRQKNVDTCPDPSTCKNCAHHILWLYIVSKDIVTLKNYYFNDPEGMKSDIDSYREDCKLNPGSYVMVTTKPIIPDNIGKFLNEISDGSQISLMNYTRNIYEDVFFKDWVNQDNSDDDNDDVIDQDDQ